MSVDTNGREFFLAIDLGASSGRAVLGEFADGGLKTTEVHRFDNVPAKVAGSIKWDAVTLFHEIIEGLGRGVEQSGDCLSGVGVDTWGVDFGLLDENGWLLATPYHYRDKRTDGVMEWVFEMAPREKIFELTGVQFLQFNTLYQLAAMRYAGRPELERARTLLMMPDLFHYLLTGKESCEFTIATTTQFYNPAKGSWATELFEAIGLPAEILPPVSPPGTLLGEVLGEAAVALAKRAAPVIAPASHDTASAVAAAPAGAGSRPGSWAYLSSGTWSLMGIEVDEPIINDKALAANFTNEGGVGGTWRFLKNISGLWTIQECRRAWSEYEGREIGWDELDGWAESAEPLAAMIDVDHKSFLRPGDMSRAIVDYCEATGQSAPNTKGGVVRCSLESLALKYRVVKDAIEDVSGHKIEVLHIIGGGSRNRTLNQMTADALGVPVLAGPVEAAAIGNLCVQAIAGGVIADLAGAREVIGNSFEVVEYEPGDTAVWDDALPCYLELLGKGAEVPA